MNMHNFQKANSVSAKRLSPLRFMPSILILGLLSGCVFPYPHRTERSPEIRGRVLDTRTHQPIQGASAFLESYPEASTSTGSEGYFRLKPTHNVHLGLTPPEGHWPQGEYYH